MVHPLTEINCYGDRSSPPTPVVAAQMYCPSAGVPRNGVNELSFCNALIVRYLRCNAKR